MIIFVRYNYTVTCIDRYASWPVELSWRGAVAAESSQEHAIVPVYLNAIVRSVRDHYVPFSVAGYAPRPAKIILRVADVPDDLERLHGQVRVAIDPNRDWEAVRRDWSASRHGIGEHSGHRLPEQLRRVASASHCSAVAYRSRVVQHNRAKVRDHVQYSPFQAVERDPVLLLRGKILATLAYLENL